MGNNNSQPLPPPRVLPTKPNPLTTKQASDLKEKLEKLKNLKPGHSLQPEELEILDRAGVKMPDYYNLGFIGCQHSGKSAFINTICRILHEDIEQLINYLQTAPSTTEHCTTII